MFQIAANDAADVDVLGLSRHPCFDAADAAHDHIHPNTGATGLADLVDDLRVIDGVVFQNHGCRKPAAGAVNLAVHLFQQNALEAQRCHQHGIGLTGQAL